MAAKRAAKDASFEIILDFGNSWSDKGEHHKRNDARSLFNLGTKQFPPSGGYYFAIWRGEINYCIPHTQL